MRGCSLLERRCEDEKRDGGALLGGVAFLFDYYQAKSPSVSISHVN